MNINNLSFSGKYHFLQKQKDLLCAYCGKPILNDAQLKELNKKLEGKKGVQIAEILEPYMQIVQGKGEKFLAEIVNHSKNPKYKDWKFKQLAMLGTEEKIYDKESQKILENMFNSIRFSVEHTMPRSNSGLNTQTNYLPMHIHCNSDRSSDNYALIAMQNPDFVENIRKSLLEIKRRILSDKAGKTNYKINLPENYFDGIKENMEKQGLSKELFVDI